MIIFELRCAGDHRFEGWFASAEAFAVQRDSGLLECPVCGSHEVTRIPHAKIAVPDASAGSTQRTTSAPVSSDATHERFRGLAAFVQQVMTEAEDVGRGFPEEARRIHYDEAPNRAIRGIASVAETRELLDEGIGVVPLPIPLKDSWN